MKEIELIRDTIKRFGERKEYPKKARLLNEGDVSEYAFFIERGCIRSWFNDDGNDITVQFFFDGGFISSFESLRLCKPSLFNIETIEPSILHAVHKDALFSALNDSPDLKEAVNELIYHRFYHYQRLFLSRIKNSPKRRYEELIRENPEIFRRVPHHYIASYLGITPVSLSRIRNKDRH
ncbi:Crp/Fnr family transcriptional regulator [Desulfoluna spongiiphila]|uniref:cAMP-binding domain of CRP or a regulatory subunit of cAMP-dependent protein kinases n=1 Tax=Desulfoluna spongiiphila TaxID=419481 RepID=A0A1G5DUX6_9BACT|nr:Crp/Fnr family transcriptional regulator [Desulfoluna spongiiphila]SCY18504.1 cAMP-binding domain of CRP or a regulatory subunit of cAMP-dependent protein kinases [Desulfoluna spongiiphila]VVS91436.1 rmlc-like jelly roll fold [Desulfoluna spongiiphila]